MRPLAVMALLFLFVSLSLVGPRPAIAGYEFSVTADSTDPRANTAAPTGAPRNLYLWLTCTDDGLAALEAGVNTTLPVYAFNPLNGVMNVGNATQLLLAVPGCPIGASVDHLLGYWVVQDSGGTLCLGPSAANSTFVAVDCDGLAPASHEPTLVGFSSSGSPPCEVGETACTVQDGGAPAEVSFVEITTLRGRLPFREPWSPTEDTLLFLNDQGTATFDLRTREVRQLATDRAARIDWSPDGRWLVFQHDAGAPPETARSLRALSLEGGVPSTVLEEGRAWQFIWASTGVIYAWDLAGERYAREPPLAWRDQHEGDRFPNRPRAVLSKAAGRHSLFAFSPDESSERALPSPWADALVAVMDETLQGSLVLAHVFPREGSPFSALMRSDGTLVHEFAPPANQLDGGLTATTMSSDGRLILGYYTVDDGHDIIASRLVATDPLGRWHVAVVGTDAALNPKLAHRSLGIVFEDAQSGELHVGYLRIRW